MRKYKITNFGNFAPDSKANPTAEILRRNTLSMLHGASLAMYSTPNYLLETTYVSNFEIHFKTDNIIFVNKFKQELSNYGIQIHPVVE